MSRPAELAGLLARLDPLRLLRRESQATHCDVAVCDLDGRPLHTQADLPHVHVVTDDGAAHAGGVDRPSAVAPVQVFERTLGFVVAVARTDDDSAVERLAEHAAGVLGALCSREYELNDLSREILSAYEELNFFYDLAGELAGASDMDAICRAVLDKAGRVIPAERGWILLSQDEGRSFRVVASHGPAAVPEAVAADPSLAAMVALTRAPGLVDDVTQLDAAALGVLERGARRTLLSVPLCVPGPADRPAIGVLQLADRIAAAPGVAPLGEPEDGADTPVFTAGDLKLAQALGGQAAILLENTRLVAFERELGIARTIQQNLLPGDPPRVPGLDVAGACQVASNVGGDYFDHVLVGDDRLGLLLADVSGHNLAAALIQTAVRSTFRAAMLSDSTPVAVLARANEVLYEDLSRSELFLTAWLGFVDVNTKRLTFGDAGHHPALLFRAASGRVEQLSAGGVPVGVLLDGLYEQDEAQLDPGDVLIVYTDGLSEARASDDPGEEYGEERLISALRDVVHCSAEEIVEHLLGAVALFSGGLDPSDDRTLIALKVIEADSR